MRGMLSRLCRGAGRMAIAVLLLLVGLLTPVHAIGPIPASPSQGERLPPTVEPAPPVALVYLAAYRAQGPPDGSTFHHTDSIIPGTRSDQAAVTWVLFVEIRGGGQSAIVSLYAYAGGDPVNRWDPSGLDDVWVEGGKVYWQAESEGGGLFGANRNVGPVVEIGTCKDGRWATIYDRYMHWVQRGTDATLDVRALIDHAGKRFSARPNARYTNGIWYWEIERAADAVPWPAMKAFDETHHRGGAVEHAADFAEGAVRPFAEPVFLAKTLGQTGLTVGSGFNYNFITAGGEYDSMLTTYAVHLRENEGAGWGESALTVGSQVFVRGNPVSGIPLAGYDMYQGFRTGEYKRAGGGTAGLAMNLLMVSGLRGVGRTPTFNAIRAQGFGTYLRGQIRTPTFSRWGNNLFGKPTGPAKGVPASYTAAENRLRAHMFYRRQGWSDAKIADHLQGIDFSKPVSATVIPKGATVGQWQVPGRPVGNYFAQPGTAPTNLGISGAGKVETVFTVPRSQSALRSTAAPVLDTWSGPLPVQTAGGATQYFRPGLVSP